jgi:hypothetical protein
MLSKEEVIQLSKYVKVENIKLFNKKFDINKVNKQVYDIFMSIKNKDLDENVLDGKLKSLTDKQYEELESLFNPYTHVVDEKNEQWYAYSSTNLEDKFNRRFLMTSLIGMLYRYVDEAEMDRFAEIYEDVKTEDDFKKTKDTLRTFLTEFFKYNPDFHTKSAFHENPKDTTKKAFAKLTPEEKNKEIYKCIPSNDLYHKWDVYTKNNYEELREATMTLYPEKPDTEEAIIIYKSFNKLEDVEKFAKQYQNKITSLIKVTRGNTWTLHGPFRSNRKSTKMYGDQSTEIFQSMINRYVEDEKIAGDMIKKKRLIKRAKNVKKVGPNHPNFAKYRAENPNAFDQLGVEVSDEEEETVDSNFYVDKDQTDDTDLQKDEIRVDITQIDAVTGETNKYVMYTEEVKNK